jgi:hypothetical protein
MQEDDDVTILLGIAILLQKLNDMPSFAKKSRDPEGGGLADAFSGENINDVLQVSRVGTVATCRYRGELTKQLCCRTRRTMQEHA